MPFTRKADGQVLFAHEVNQIQIGIESNEAALDTKADVAHNHPEYAETVNVDVALEGKADVEHEHDITDTTGLQDALNAKANVTHVHTDMATDTELAAGLATKADVTHNHDDRYFTETETNTLLGGKANTSHTHAIADTTGLQSALNNKASTAHTHTEYATDIELANGMATKADVNHTHDEYVTDAELATAMDGVGSTEHTHEIADVTNLQTTLDGKADDAHNHDADYAPITHTHEEYATDTELTDGLATKADSTHTHDGLVSDAELTTALSTKADTTHDHDADYAPITHEHTEYATDQELTDGLATKANTAHNHTAWSEIAHTHTYADIQGMQDQLDGKAEVEAGVPTGGTTGQILSKVDDTNFNTTWIEAPTGGGGAGSLASPAMISGGYYGSITHGAGIADPGSTSVSQGSYANRHFATMFFVPTTTTFNRAAIQFDSANVGGQFRFGIYTIGANGLPDALILQTNTANAATGRIEIIINQTLEGGQWYALAFVCANSGNQIVSISRAAYGVFGLRANSFRDVTAECYVDRGTLVMPASFGTPLGYTSNGCYITNLKAE